ncbi:hypothetical protein BDB01DRAFT_808748 [Pilobolus umbonatus]|nr:hypothetical protein BDB01DRAFT_808748 [Pilobolus umbonatus]
MGECMDCYHRFKFTLTGLKFRAPGEYPNYTAISLTNYFGSFTQLASLYVTISKKAFKKVPMFDRILKKCPKLIHIHYDGVSLNSPAIDRSKDQQSFIMEELSLWVDHFYMKDVQYIRSKFKCLKKLSLHIRGKVQDEWEVLKELSEIESTQEVETSIDMVGMDSVILFWNQTLSSSKGITGNKAYFTVSAEEDNDVLISYKKNPVTGITNIETEVFCPGDKKLLYIDYLEKIGLHLDELHFTDCDTGIQVNLEIINRLCPSLTKLKFEGDKLITNKGTPVPNLNLITFEIEGCTFGNSTVKAIETIYPSLKTLQLKSVHFSFKPNKSKINYISLPKGLLKIETSAKFYQRVIGQVMVLKEVDSLPVRSWHLCSVTKKIIITDGEEIGSVIKKLATEQLLILKSSTLEKVHLNRSL